MEIEKNNGKLRLKFKNINIAIGYKSTKDDLILFNDYQDLNSEVRHFDTPGEYEIKDLLIDGIKNYESIIYQIGDKLLNTIIITDCSKKITEEAVSRFDDVDLLILNLSSSEKDIIKDIHERIEAKIIVMYADDDRQLKENSSEISSDLDITNSKFKINPKKIDPETQVITAVN